MAKKSAVRRLDHNKQKLTLLFLPLVMQQCET
jgi:hypothetical protein